MADSSSRPDRYSFATRIYLLLSEGLFRGYIEPAPDPTMTRLLLGVYIFHLASRPLEKKRAGELSGAQDVKTGRKYIVLAEDQGLISVRTAEWDKRLDLLTPTKKLDDAAEQALSNLYLQIQPLPSNSDKNERIKRYLAALDQFFRPSAHFKSLADKSMRAGEEAQALIASITEPPATEKTKKKTGR